ncbi:hypothetical protein ACFQY0_20850 [Haloferula chungangensis]|uniref:Uncharacterized protein n=1 Tax=Haloferula chungangensis TaxID=1048331 RepID=A0ABW2LB02_9BACT
MQLKRVSRADCYAVLESYQNKSDHADFSEEFGGFCQKVAGTIRECGATAVFSESAPDAADFLLPTEDSYPDDRTLVLVTFNGSKLTAEILFELSRLVQEHKPEYHIFIDGQVSHGKSFEIVLQPDGQVLGDESERTDLLGGLGFPKVIQKQ